MTRRLQLPGCVPPRALAPLSALLLLPALFTSCARAPTPPDTQPAPPPATQPVGVPATQSVNPPATATAASALRDWVVDPPVADAERDAPCPRLLSAAPNVTEICCALGLRDRLVGRTRYCTYPPAVQSVPSIGALNDLNVEALLDLKPELILISGHSRAIADRLSRLELRYESVPDVTVEDLFAAIRRIGELTARPETARQLADGVRGDLAAVVSRYAPRPKARVLLLTDPLPDPPAQADVAGPGSFYDDLLRLAGHTNVAAPLGQPFGRLSLEFLLQADPDVIIEIVPSPASRPAGDADALRVWGTVGPLKAVAARRVYVLAGPQYTLLGPRIAQTLDAMCRAIAGDAHD